MSIDSLIYAPISNEYETTINEPQPGDITLVYLRHNGDGSLTVTFEATKQNEVWIVVRPFEHAGKRVKWKT